MLFFILFFVCLSKSSFLCSNGCSDDCIADYTCSSCKNGFDNDTSCLHCQMIDEYSVISDLNPLYVKENNYCVKAKNYVIKDSYIPVEIMYNLTFGEHVILNFNSSTPYDRGPCSIRGDTQNNYRQGFWFSIDLATVSEGINKVRLVANHINGTNPIYIDCSTSPIGTINPICYGRQLARSGSESNFLQLPVENGEGDDHYYFWVYIDEAGDVTIDLIMEEVLIEQNLETFQLTKEMFGNMIENNESVRVLFKIREEGKNIYPVCSPNFQLRSVFFDIHFEGNYSLIISTKEENRIRYLQEYGTDNNGSYWCVKMWVGERHGTLVKQGTQQGIEIKVNADPINGVNKYFCLMTQEQDVDIPVTFTAICKDNCNYENGYGFCSSQKRGCICKDGYGADNCRQLCYYNGSFVGSSGNGMCYFGTPGCGYDCYCKKGYSLVNHYCLSNDCKNGVNSSDFQCFYGSEGCQPSCECDNSKYVSFEGKCRKKTCGDLIVDSDEECDGGLNCNEYCYCEEGFIPNEDKNGSCYKKEFPKYGWILIGVAATLFLVISVIIVIFFTLRMTHKMDVDTLKQQQPSYYFYIRGSKNAAPSKETKYFINPLNLDFGNENSPTEVFETRFERIDIKNKSKNKYMMVIVHTPNNPKYVFHFEPQTKILSPKSNSQIICYMTLHCTTKIKDMKIPYTIWFSKSKKILESIAALLKDKSFDDWKGNNQDVMDKLCKKVLRKFHFYFKIMTESASSTHIDMDELNMSETPIAEGAMGKVFIGSYRSVPVAVKQFRWENLTEEETLDLKIDVINECEIMSKLRNPFIANYMGSVTYLPQVSMVIQFFVLGGLGEYLRKYEEFYCQLPYKLKVKMLFDTARGMTFLHENNIMHLDLKPDNLLVNSLYAESPCCIKITDFGTSRFTQKTNKSEDKGLGTPLYLAPECYHDEYSFCSDVFAFAVTAWEIFYEEEPYEEFKSLFDIRKYIEGGKRLGFDKTIPHLYKELIEECWSNNSEERPTFDEISNKLVKIMDEVDKYSGLDVTVDPRKIEAVIQSRNERLAKLLKDTTLETLN